MNETEMNGKMEFVYQFSDKHPKVSITLIPDMSLPEVLEAFEGFLQAAGYSFDGYLDFVNEEKE